MTMKDRYQVKWTDKNGTVQYGIYRDRSFHSYDKSYKRIPKDSALVDDAILPVCHAIPETALTDVPFGMGDGELEKHVNADYAKAKKISDAIKSGVQVGSLFSIGVADGSAYYVVTKVSSRSCDVEWRGYGGGDRYTDHYFGWGRKKVPLADVRRYVEGARFMSKLFGKKGA